MKIQEVILKAMAGKLKWWEAAEIIGVTDRTMRRWRQQYQEHGYSGLWDCRKRRPSPKRVPVADLEKVLQLYRERYFDFNVQHFHEKLAEEHGLAYSYTWVKTALQEAGLVARRKKRGSHGQQRQHDLTGQPRLPTEQDPLAQHAGRPERGRARTPRRPGVDSLRAACSRAVCAP